MGQLSLYKVDWDRRTAEFGRILIGERDAAGQGYAAEATALALQLAWNDWQLHEIVLEVFAENERAIRIYEKQGFVRTGASNGLISMRITRPRLAA